MLGRPRALANFHVRDERMLAIHRPRIVIREIIHQLFNAHRIGRRQLAVLQQIRPHARVTRRVDVDRERRQRIGLDRFEIVFIDAIELIATLAGAATFVEAIDFRVAERFAFSRRGAIERIGAREARTGRAAARFR